MGCAGDPPEESVNFGAAVVLLIQRHKKFDVCKSAISIEFSVWGFKSMSNYIPSIFSRISQWRKIVFVNFVKTKVGRVGALVVWRLGERFEGST